jgi:hypothetical protein
MNITPSSLVNALRAPAMSSFRSFAERDHRNLLGRCESLDL